MAADLPLGAPVPGWAGSKPPFGAVLAGRHACLAPFDLTRDAAALHEAFASDASGDTWAYLGYGPFAQEADFRAWLARDCTGSEPCFYTVMDQEKRPLGLLSYLRIRPSAGSVEIGHIHFSLRLKRTVHATEALYLAMRHAMDDLGYRRLEWKCNALNAPSARAAERLGFTYEGTFRQDMVVKGRNRDTAWYSLLDHEWPPIKARFEAWLAPENFTRDGKQKCRLEDVIV